MSMIGEIPVPVTFPLHLTINEANQLLNLMDLAVKAGGIQAAFSAVPLATKLQAAATQPPNTKEPE